MIGALGAAAVVAGLLTPPGAAAVDPGRLGVEQLAGLRVVHGFAGPEPPEALVRRVRRGRAGGVILFAGNVAGVEGLRRLTDRLQSVPRPRAVDLPLLVMTDQEGGRVRRVPVPPVRTAAEIGADGPETALSAGRATGRALDGVGVNVDLAPVADVAAPGSAIARDRRAFGSSPAGVARAAVAFARGLGEAGVAATAKHFPGFGAAPVSTDDAPVVIRRRATALRRRDGRPFRALIAHGVPLVMVSTAVYPALDPGRPAALSRRIVTGELRGRLGFRGVTITDALDTPALSAEGGPGPAALRAARAGADLVLVGGRGAGARARAAIARGIRTGELSRAEAEAAAARVLALRGRLGAR